MPQARCLACSDDDSLLFVGGGEDSVSGKPVIAAVAFNASLQVVCEQEFDFPGLSMVYSLRK